MPTPHTDWEAVYRQHRQGLFTLALAVTGSAAAAEDAVHDVFVRLLTRSDTAPDDPVAFAFASVRRAAIDQRRRRRGDGRETLHLPVEDDPSLGLEAADEAQRLREAVERLDDDEREAVALRIHAGLTFAQIAAVVGAPLSAVATRYARALERLQAMLAVEVAP